ncbi:MAG: hypothetical protein EBS32_05180 [Actinobacteria bacterium]|nr:hypothetical protein [Actinomycetota bacterium]
MRELRYDNNNPQLGVKYMRSLGIRYYMAFTPEAVSKAATEPDLKEVATTGPWHIYEIADTILVEPLNVQPVVVNQRDGDQRERWLEVGMSWFQHGDEWAALPVADGPAGWQHIDAVVDTSRQVGQPGESGRQVDIVKPGGTITATSLPVVKVSNIDQKDESISFDVDRTGVPVLVKVSYFPNWEVKGASAVYRAAPNMMVVVPTSTHVTLSYEPSGLDNFSYVLTFAGICMVVWFARRRFRYGTAMPERRSVVIDDEELGLASAGDDN